MQTTGNISKYELRKSKILPNGKGTFADVHIGIFRGSPVAMKVFHLKSMPPHINNEWKPYLEASHPNLLQYYGICDAPGKFSMIIELMPYSLQEFYTTYELSSENIYKFAEQIAQGLSYLHSQKYGHKHLKSNNIFVNSDLIIKITDFGLSKLKLESSSNGAGGEATVRWRAPETFTREYSRVKDTLEAQESADVYSLGMVFWEMKKRKKPFATYNEPGVVQLLSVGTREEIDFNWPKHFKDLLLKTWDLNPDARPSADEIITILNHKDFDLENARNESVKGFIAGIIS